MSTVAPTGLAVCVFCSSSDVIDPRHHLLAAEVGREIGRRGHRLVSGGGSVGSMGAVARAARESGAHTTGVIPRALVAHEVADHDADTLVVTDDMRERKGIMDNRSDAFLTLPGGIGTLEELLEVWTARTLGMHTKPVVILDPWGDLALLRDLVDGLTDRGFLRAGAASGVTWVTSVPDAFAAIEAPRAPYPDDGSADRELQAHAAEAVESAP